MQYDVQLHCNSINFQNQLQIWKFFGIVLVGDAFYEI